MSEKVLVSGLDGIHTEIELTFSFRISASSSKKKGSNIFSSLLRGFLIMFTVVIDYRAVARGGLWGLQPPNVWQNS